MKEYLVPKYLLPLLAVFFIMSYITISIKNTPPKLYAVCGDKHIVLLGNRLTINTKTRYEVADGYESMKVATPYKVRKIFLTDRVVWYRHAEHCTGGSNSFYKNTFHSFDWDIESKKAEYYESSAVRTFTNQCTIPDSAAPDWVVARDFERKAINLDCS